MQTISQNPITQGKHGAYNAVDIAPNPDVYYYAPEDGTITAWGDSGTCGLRLELSGATGRHGFCHNESSLVNVGQKVKRGQKLAKMGWTGYVLPPGPGGRHVHWVIQRNGVYVYPPSLVNESFIKLGSGGNDVVEVLNRGDVVNMYRAMLGRDPSEQEINIYDGKTWKTVVEAFVGSDEFKRRVSGGIDRGKVLDYIQGNLK